MILELMNFIIDFVVPMLFSNFIDANSKLREYTEAAGNHTRVSKKYSYLRGLQS